MTDLKDMKREDIFNTDLLGEGIPDLGEEIAKLQSGGLEGLESEATPFGFGDEPDEDFEEEED